MSGNTVVCDDQCLERMLREELSGADAQRMLEHIEGCSRCQQRLETLAAGSDQWMQAGAALTDPENLSSGSLDLPLSYRPVAWTEAMAEQLLAPPSHPEMLGRLGRYEVERLVGAGGMGIVFKAFDSELNRPVAVKVLAPYLAGSGPARKRFAREARAAAAVVHQHVVPIHNVETERESPFIVMQYISGESLQARIDRDGPLELCEILRIGMQVADGLAAAHQQGLVHRDIKPANILLEEEVDRALISDFGLARAADDASLTRTGFHPGTPQYMSPEQAAGQSVDARSDLFSLGSVLYTMCTGRPPFRAETGFGVLRRITDSEPRPIRELNPEIPGWLCTVIARLMEKSKQSRFQNANDVHELLEGCLGHVQQPTTASLPDALSPPDDPSNLTTSPPIPGGAQRVSWRRLALFVPAVAAGLILLLAPPKDSTRDGKQGAVVDGGAKPNAPPLETAQQESPQVGKQGAVATATDAGAEPDAKPRQPTPIALHNVAQVGLISEAKRGARYIELGPADNELTLFPRNGVVVVDDTNMKVLRSIDNERTVGYSISQDRSLTSWRRGQTVFVREESTGTMIEIKVGERPGNAVFSPDNKVAAIAELTVTGSEGQGSAALHIYDAKSGERIRTLESSSKGYGGLTPVFSPDGSILAVGNRNYETKLFDTKTWTLMHTLPKRMTHELAFSPDGKSLAVGYVDGTVALWDVATGKSIHSVKSVSDEIHSVAWSPAGDLLATAGPTDGHHGPGGRWEQAPGKILIWDAKTFKVVKDLMTVQWSGSVRFTRDGARLVATVRKQNSLDDSLRLAVWSTDAPPPPPVKSRAAAPKLESAQSIQLPELGMPTLSPSPDGSRLLAPLGNRGRCAIWRFGKEEPVLELQGRHDWQISCVAFHPDDEMVATASLDKTAKLWSAKTGELLATLKGHTDRLEYATFSPSGKRLFTSTGKTWPYEKAGTVEAKIWDTQTGKLTGESSHHTDTINEAIFLDDEKRVLTRGDDHVARIWDVETGKELRKLEHRGSVSSMSLSPDGRTILTSSSGSRSVYAREETWQPEPDFKLWDAGTGKQLAHRTLPQYVTAAFDETGGHVITACRGVITYWDSQSGDKLRTLREPHREATVAFSPQRDLFLVVTPDQPAELWSTANQRVIRELDVHKPYKTFFSEDGKVLYSLTRQGRLTVWNLKGVR